MKWTIGARKLPWLLVLSPFLIFLAVLACSGPKPTSIPTASLEWVEQTIQTTSYTVKVRVGPAAALEAMQPGAVMAMSDQGQAVNHHLEVRIFVRNSGADLKTLIPGVAISQQATKLSRGLPNAEACLLANHRVTEPHFGDNLYLANGTYTITVVVGTDTAVFKDVVVNAGR